MTPPTNRRQAADEQPLGVDLRLGDCLGILPTLSDIDLIVTSPPYFNAKEYSYFENYEDYMSFMREFLKHSYTCLKDGGRLCLNIPDGYGRNPWVPIYANCVMSIIMSGFTLRGSIVWNKGTGAGKTSWGSWRSSSNPCLIDEHEMIIIAHKGSPRITGSPIERDYFLQSIHSVWNIKPETKRDHPAPFPLEIPRKLITLYSGRGDTVCDPFAGSGTTGVACIQIQRNFVGIERNVEYYDKAKMRLDAEHAQMRMRI